MMAAPRASAPSASPEIAAPAPIAGRPARLGRGGAAASPAGGCGVGRWGGGLGTAASRQAARPGSWPARSALGGARRPAGSTAALTSATTEGGDTVPTGARRWPGPARRPVRRIPGTPRDGAWRGRTGVRRARRRRTRRRPRPRGGPAPSPGPGPRRGARLHSPRDLLQLSSPPRRRRGDAPSELRSAARPRWILLLTVPSFTPSVAPISS